MNHWDNFKPNILHWLWKNIITWHCTSLYKYILSRCVVNCNNL